MIPQPAIIESIRLSNSLLGTSIRKKWKKTSESTIGNTTFARELKLRGICRTVCQEAYRSLNVPGVRSRQILLQACQGVRTLRAVLILTPFLQLSTGIRKWYSILYAIRLLTLRSLLGSYGNRFSHFLAPLMGLFQIEELSLRADSGQLSAFTLYINSD